MISNKPRPFQPVNSLILGIESSCDDTAAAVLKNGNQLLSNITYSQIELHQPFGGVVPELAARDHLRQIVPVIEKSLQEARVNFSDLTAVAATRGPGLIGSLLCGLQAGKALAYAFQLPFVGIHHHFAHISASFYCNPPPTFPFLCLVVSGGHTSLSIVSNFDSIQIIGNTRDDAVGEAFDKIAKVLGFPYPGGKYIEQNAKDGNIKTYQFPKSMPQKNTLDFSYSGLKTAAINLLKNSAITFNKTDFCAGIQHALVEQLLRKTLLALEKYHLSRLVIVGGVACNQYLRDTITYEVKKLSSRNEVFIPEKKLCTDNGAMVAMAGFIQLSRGIQHDFSIDAKAYLPL